MSSFVESNISYDDEITKNLYKMCKVSIASAIFTLEDYFCMTSLAPY
jgi:hypothetical protein